jgi:hypothetical protein
MIELSDITILAHFSQFRHFGHFPVKPEHGVLYESRFFTFNYPQRRKASAAGV